MANTMPSLQHPFLQQRPCFSAFSHSSLSSTSIISSSSPSSSSCRIFRVVGCHQTSAASPLNEANGNSESSDNQSTEISFEVPSKGRMAADALELLKDCQLSVRQFNPRLYVAQIPLISNLEVWFQRPKDVVRKLLSGDLDLGTVGYDTLNDGQTKGSILLRRSSKDNEFGVKSSFFIQMGLLAITQVAEPALAVTGVNYEEDLISVLIKAAIVAFGYFLIMPPIIMNWLRIRWYRRNLLEMYLQFMCVFLFFPGVLLWAPFLNFRKFPRDPTMKYPWSKPENPSEVRGGFLKFPWATIEDYE